MRDALLYIDPAGGPASESTLRYAAQMSAQFGTEVTGVAFAYDVAVPISLYVPHMDESYTSALREENRKAAEAALGQADKIFQSAGGKFIGIKEECNFVEAVDRLVDYARLRDVAILPNASGKGPLDQGLIEQMLFDSGRPLLLVPDAGKTEFRTECILIAWDYSRPAVRAVADALPLLTRAKEVHVVTVTDEKEITPRQGPIEFTRHLAHHKVEARVQQITSDGIDIVEVLTEHAGRVGADLMVMGGYGHSRLRQFILGGATASVLEQASLPILMSH